MKTSTATIAVERSGVTAENVFRIKATGKAFKILSDGLYTDKIGAVIRELSCNAYDAHVAAGKASTPFDIRLPNTLEPSFSIRDYGTGLSHDGVMSLYTTYFESTKSDSNDFIGALGLGSKSPFSYVDQFTVRSWHGGRRRTYSAFIGEHGVPSIALLEDVDSVEPVGLEVSFPVKLGDSVNFVDRAKKYLKWFNPVPNIRGAANLVIEADKPILSGNGWYLRASDHSHYASPTPYALMGRVAYPLQAKDFSNLTADLQWLLGLPLVLNFNIGDLEVAASREALSLDARTIDNVKARLLSIRAAVTAEAEKRIAAAPTFFDACRTWEALSNDTGDVLRDLKRAGFKAQWRGRKLEYSYSVDVPAGWQEYHGGRRDLKIQKARLYAGGQHNALHIDCRPSQTNLIYVDDVGTGRLARLAAFARSTYFNGYVHVLVPPTGAAIDVNAVQDALQGCPVALLSTLPEPPKGSAAGRTKTAKLYRYKEGEYRNRAKWPDATVDYAAGGVYVHVENFEPRGLPIGLSALLAAAQARGFNGPLYGIPATHRKTFANNSTGWVFLVDWVKTRVEAELSPSYLQSIADNAAWAALPDAFHPIHRASLRYDLGSPALPALTLKAPRTVDTSRYELAQTLGLTVTLPAPSFDYTAIVAAFLARYPLLSRLNYFDKDVPSMASDYLKVVDLAYPA